MVVQRIDCATQCVQPAAHAIEHAAAFFGQAHPAGRARQQAHPQALLQRTHRLRQGRGGEAHLGRRAAEAGVAGDAFEGGQRGQERGVYC
ncbi:hypothetical protein SDC9_204614 [bioreactor metagenome]|uniref:Uncharacterized protein n=1 Tax=bioreactor metagenome TaxID=1076179 RepID=A0A645J021_9ZZZZ